MPTNGEPPGSRTGVPPVPDKQNAPAAGLDGQDARPTAKPAPAAATPKPAAPAAPPPPPPPVPSALAHVRLPFEGVDHGFRGVNAEARVSPERVVEAASLLDDEGFSLDTITGVDWIAEGQMELIYDYFHPDKSLRVAVRARIPREKPEIATISDVFPGANWHERETHDFFGIVFTGHPNLEPFLLPEDATYHPLRKDFTSCS